MMRAAEWAASSAAASPPSRPRRNRSSRPTRGSCRRRTSLRSPVSAGRCSSASGFRVAWISRGVAARSNASNIGFCKDRCAANRRGRKLPPRRDPQSNPPPLHSRPAPATFPAPDRAFPSLEGVRMPVAIVTASRRRDAPQPDRQRIRSLQTRESARGGAPSVHACCAPKISAPLPLAAALAREAQLRALVPSVRRITDTMCGPKRAGITGPAVRSSSV